MKHKTIAEQYKNRCIHFTGIMNDECKLGVKYAEVRDETGSPYKFPCLADSGVTDRCAMTAFPTQEEAETHEREGEERLLVLLKEISEGKCPHCHQVVEKRQVGPCVYGSCGHRLYQGKV